jgi:hypothetical protein
MDKRSDINWSLVARDAFEKAMQDMPDPKHPVDPFDKTKYRKSA